MNYSNCFREHRHLTLGLVVWGLMSLQACSLPAPRTHAAPVVRKTANKHPTQPKAQTYEYSEAAGANEAIQIQALPPNNAVQDSAVQSTASSELSPAVIALVNEAEINTRSGQFDSAASKIERALRIDSRNPELTFKLAEIRLKQEQPKLSEELAKRADVLAGNQRSLKARIWNLIAQSKIMQRDAEGQAVAEKKAAEYQ